MSWSPAATLQAGNKRTKSHMCLNILYYVLSFVHIFPQKLAYAGRFLDTYDSPLQVFLNKTFSQTIPAIIQNQVEKIPKAFRWAAARTRALPASALEKTPATLCW